LQEALFLILSSTLLTSFSNRLGAIPKANAAKWHRPVISFSDAAEDVYAVLLELMFTATSI
jgi:hypothetical protein